MTSSLDQQDENNTRYEPNLVSTIIIFLNAERFIEEAIESVLAQRYTHWELLLVDDGSSDASTEIARGYAARFPGQVRYLEHEHHQNRGMSASRNLGIRHSRGELVAFLDADDVWLPRKLEEQVDILRNEPEAALVYGAAEFWYGWSNEPADMFKDFKQRLGQPVDAIVQPPDLLIRFLNDISASPSPSGIVARRELIDRVGGFEERFTGVNQLYEDQAFYSKVGLAAPMYVSSTLWYRYRRHPDACGTVVSESGHHDDARSFFLSWLARYFASQGYTDRRARRAIARELWPYRHPRLNRVRRASLGRVAAARRMMLRTAVSVIPGSARDWLRAREPGLATVADRWV
jgi:glycosyltransferase involved in cell wall biosynthesis